MGISPLQLLIILLIVLALFGTKKLRNIGSDLGGAIKGFKKAMKDEEEKKDDVKPLDKDTGHTIEGEVKKVEPSAEKNDSEPKK